MKQIWKIFFGIVNMRNNLNFYHVIVIIFIIQGCAPQIAPNGYLPTSKQTQSDTFGGWIEIENENEIFSGELIAINSDSLFILSNEVNEYSFTSNDKLNVISKSDIINMRLDKYDSKSVNMFGWTTVGIYSTLTHGLISSFTAPLWLIIGTFASSSQSKKPIIKYPNSSFDDFIPFSRFPQGLPDGFNRDNLKSKSYLPSFSPKTLITIGCLSPIILNMVLLITLDSN